jgi:hypothetical protein
VETRTALGRWLPWAANGLCALFVNSHGQHRQHDRLGPAHRR